jgi:inhibitor of KinA sporulation pathway (predicted exonuclease)
VDNGIILQKVLQNYHYWLKSKGLVDKPRSIAFVTCGGIDLIMTSPNIAIDWDLKSCLPNQLDYLQLPVPTYFRQWINIKKFYSDFYHRRMVDMVGMLEGLRIPLDGRHHSGIGTYFLDKDAIITDIDDCYNISKILRKMLQDGAVFDWTYTK